MSKPFGLSVALTTPFKADGTLDLALLADHAAACLKRGANGVTLFGTTGEGASIGAAERGAAFDALIAAGVPAGSIVAGVLVNAVDDAVAQACDALRRGAKAILLAPPSYFKGVNDDGVHAWFASVIEGLGMMRARRVPPRRRRRDFVFANSGYTYWLIPAYRGRVDRFGCLLWEMAKNLASLARCTEAKGKCVVISANTGISLLRSVLLPLLKSKSLNRICVLVHPPSPESNRHPRKVYGPLEQHFAC